MKAETKDEWLSSHVSIPSSVPISEHEPSLSASISLPLYQDVFSITFFYKKRHEIVISPYFMLLPKGGCKFVVSRCMLRPINLTIILNVSRTKLQLLVGEMVRFHVDPKIHKYKMASNIKS